MLKVIAAALAALLLASCGAAKVEAPRPPDLPWPVATAVTEPGAKRVSTDVSYWAVDCVSTPGPGCYEKVIHLEDQGLDINCLMIPPDSWCVFTTAETLLWQPEQVIVHNLAYIEGASFWAAYQDVVLNKWIWAGPFDGLISLPRPGVPGPGPFLQTNYVTVWNVNPTDELAMHVITWRE